jgi:hypothetical protein
MENIVTTIQNKEECYSNDVGRLDEIMYFVGGLNSNLSKDFP